MICPNCGMNNRGDAKFCKSCGTPTNVSTPSAGEQAGVITIADNMPQGLSVFEQMVGLEVVFISGLRGGERSVITKFPATIGRDPNSTLPLALHDQLASTRHAQIRYENRRFILKDVGSSNGTYREGQRITESTLGNGDVFEFGIGGPKIKFNILANGQSIANAPSEAQTLQPMSPADLMPTAPPPPPPPPAPVLPPPVSLGEVSRADSLPEWARNAPIPPNANVARPQSFISEEIPPPAPPPPPPPPPAPVVEPPPVYSAPPAPATYAPPPPPPPMMSTPPAGNPPVMVSSQVEGQLPSTDAAPPKKKGSTLIIIIVLVLVIFLLLLAVAAVVAWKFLK